MTGHLDADALAEYREGLPGRRRSARIRAHLAGCSQCSAMDRDLAEVSTLLAAAPAPRMPDELAGRLQGVLAAEAAARAARPAPAQAPAQPDTAAGAQHGAAGAQDGASRRSRTARTPRQRRVLALRVASATAVVAVLAGVGLGLGLGLSSGPGGSSGSGSSGGELAGRAPANGSAGVTAGPNMAPEQSPSGSSISLPGGAVPVLHSGRNYLPASLAAQAAAVLGSNPAHGSASAGPAVAGGSQQLSDCVRRVTGGAQPTLVDQARYRGQPATVIVQAPAAGRAGQVWVTGPGCSATHPDLLTHTLLTTTG